MRYDFDIVDYYGIEVMDGNSDEFEEIFGYTLDEETSTIPECDWSDEAWE